MLRQRNYSPRFGALVVILALAVGAPTAYAQESAVDTLLKQAASLESRGRLDLAVQTWQRALLAAPDQPDALLGLARNAKRQGNFAEADRLVARLRQVAPGRPEISEIEAIRSLAGKQDRLDEARRLADSEQYEQAMAIYREVLGPEPGPGGWATSYYETEAATPSGWPNAVSGLRKLVSRFPDAAAYKLSLGRLLTYRPETRLEGVAMLQTVVGDAETVRIARSARRQALIWEGASTRAVPALEAYLAETSDPELGQILEASRTTRSARVDVSGAAEARGYSEMAAGRFQEAEQAFSEALRVSPKSAGATAGLGYLRMKQERFQDAVTYLTTALELAPGDKVMEEALRTSRFVVAVRAGDAAFSQGEMSAAAGHFREALELQPDSIDAARGLAGALMRQGRPGEAAPLFERVVAAQPDDLDSWKGLLRTIYDSNGAAATLERHKRVPEEIAFKLGDDVENEILMASVYGKTGRQAQFDAAFQKVLRMTPNEAGAMTPVRLQFAGLLNEMGRSLEAAAEYERAVEADPGNLDAWDGLIAALMNENNGRAMAVLSRMPRDVYDRALERPSFLFNVGLIHKRAGRLEEASVFLRSSLGMGDKLSREIRIQTRLQLAYIERERMNWAEAERSLRNLTVEFPQEADVWKAMIATLHEQGRHEEARAEADRIPATVITRLYSDPEYVALMASIHNARGDYEQGLRLVQDAIAIYKIERRTVPADLEIQQGWLLLNAGTRPHEQYALLQQGASRQDLTPKQRAEYTEMWTIWSLRESKAASDSGDFERANAILKAALKLFPEDTRLYAALAGTLLDAGDSAQALLVYRSWGLRNASADDYAGAVGAAMTMKDQRSVSRWLRESLQQWPREPKLLTLAGREAASRGDYQKAEQYWRMALEAMPEENPLLRLTPDGQTPVNREAADLGRLLLAGVVDPQATEAPIPLGRASSAPWTNAPTPPYSGAAEPVAESLTQAFDPVQRRGPQDYNGPTPTPRTPFTASTPTPQAPFAASATPARAPYWNDRAALRTPAAPLPVMAVAPVERPKADPRRELEDDLATLHSRNSPYTGVAPRLRSRSGRDGFETLSEQQLNFEASTVFRDKFRLGIYARPTFLDGGDGSGSNELRLGIAPLGSQFGSNTASGIGAEVQLSSENFGLKVGSTPDGFLVRNATLGLRVRPANGPFTLMFDRDVVKDTLVSYAGVRDPISGQVFGGVMSNALSLQVDKGRAQSGVYARAGYQHLTGEHVQTNRRIDGGGGAWWRVLETPDGSLTFGVNLFGMKYDRNLRYFTLGHGGYFSPQRYVLFNAPLTWQGTYDGRFDYTISGSLGLQHIMEDDSAFFPLDAALQGRKGPVYTGLTQTGEHFSLRMEGGYRIAPHWSLGGFVDLNNTRNYTDQSAGFYLRYVFREQPLLRGMNVSSLPDWAGNRRLGLP